MTQPLIEEDSKNRLAALDISQSFIVQAPAGSGKTEILIQRFLTLLTQVNSPEEILAITFTKKAANEMRLRVIKALKIAQTEPCPDNAHEQLTWNLAKQALQRNLEKGWELINNPNRLRIQTIDSLCTQLTKQLPLLSHFGAQPDISENVTALYREAVQEILSHVEENFSWSNAIANLLLHLDNDLNKLHDLLINLLAKRDQWLPFIHFDLSDVAIKNQLEKQLQAVIHSHLATLKKLFPKEIVNECLAIARFAFHELDETNELSLWQRIGKLLLTKSHSWRKRFDQEMGFPALTSLKNPVEKATHQAFRQRLTEVIAQLSTHETLREALEDLTYLPEATFSDELWAILKDLLQLLKMTAAQLRVTFKQYGHIDFIENAQAALSALGDEEHPTDLALALDYRINHLLVDEFQDTAYTQYQLLEKLTAGWQSNDGRSLFVVGDPMQSIYRFREAEVGLFLRMRANGIGQINLIPLTLSQNFRSTNEIVRWNNDKFKAIFPSQNNISTGAVTFTESVSKSKLYEKIDSAVSLKGFQTRDQEHQAEAIIAIINERQSQNKDEKIALLVRSRSHLKRIIPALKKANIHYHAVEIDALQKRQHIQDLLSLTTALMQPADRIAWLSILRAPWCGLLLEDLHKIANINQQACIIDQLNNEAVIQSLSANGRMRIQRIMTLLNTKLLERERTSLRTWIEGTWIALGGPACLNEAIDYDDVKTYFDLLTEMDEAGISTDLSSLKDKVDHLLASHSHEEAAVQIMTIHSAKGLEFDTVILPHLESKASHDEPPLLQWMEQPLNNNAIALLLAPIHATGNDKGKLYEYITRIKKIKAEHECQRLFYVATTRAKKNLYLLFNIEKNDKGDYRAQPNSFLENLWPLIANDATNIVRDEPEVIQHQEDHLHTKRPIARLSSTWQHPCPIAELPAVAMHKKQSGFLLTSPTPRLIGTITHRVLEQIATNNIAWWQQINDAEQSQYLLRLIKQMGINREEESFALSTIKQNLQHTLADKRGQWILSSHNESASEFALTAVIDHAVENIIVDRTFVDENNIRWIIDYKTADFNSKNLDEFLVREKEKYQEQMAKYAEALRHIDEREIRLGLYFPAIPAWCEWESAIA